MLQLNYPGADLRDNYCTISVSMAANKVRINPRPGSF